MHKILSNFQCDILISALILKEKSIFKSLEKSATKQEAAIFTNHLSECQRLKINIELIKKQGTELML